MRRCGWITTWTSVTDFDPIHATQAQLEESPRLSSFHDLLTCLGLGALAAGSRKLPPAYIKAGSAGWLALSGRSVF